MKLVKKFLALFFLVFGIPLSAGMFWEIINPKTTPEDKKGAVAALVVFTIPSTMIGSWLSWSVIQESKKQKTLLLEAEQKHLQSVFLELVESNSGTITVLQMAKNADISTQKAKEYLDEKAKELNASFEVGENGNILYRFS
ncbi:MAG: hypothetical protein RMY62_022865 [Nostoc sp. ZfuVER08]|jgi:hypothetical protein|uniref:Uncharacterized protein n=1 Tax=Nostoc punctiforme FACHB-252 TaxID=1357509 RepID=A0ABR8HJD1_NOSPU|nr:hypothetical protein [Nostoc punctiforme]MBD2615193.1 hypothetical protein [Nostoc punctiforme FACHB-252]MBL1200248.1 hypothetical protein [Nostoc sp. GBBB01]MDZ8012030.1 hypothetical protein [Nostoc sp. ZfuVER08]